jgi:superfamily II DNA/RNA helicase
MLAAGSASFIQTSINPLIHSLVIPDLWQQDAVRALREGRDVVVHAPTGAGKTYIFELFLPELRGSAVFTVPTRALANDKLAEWRTRAWDVGISTGDLALRLDAKVVVATLETQKGKFLQRTGPKLLVVDEYQMISDAVRGVNYELALALAPQSTQLLLLSGSVANPQDVVAWLRRIGRDAVLIRHDERPVPLHEVDLETLPNRAPHSVREWWPRLITNALHAALGPVLLFAPRRNAAEELARQLASALPVDAPLTLTQEQQQLAGPALTRLLTRRVAFHHSGLSYAQRAGLIEPLAKNGQLRAVVATMGLAAGINFSMRSVAVTGTSYLAGNFEREVQPDELLQMFGRAGRRGLDEAGYALISEKPPRLHDARPRHLRRSTNVDWPTLIAVMRGASDRGGDRFAAAIELNRRLFTAQDIPLGVEHSLATGPMPCGLRVDAERARFIRRGVVEILNSRGEWEPKPAKQEPRPLGECLVLEGDRWRPAVSVAKTLDGLGFGSLCKLPGVGERRYGRELAIGTRRSDGSLTLAPRLRAILKVKSITHEALVNEVLPRLRELTGGDLVALEPRGEQLFARVHFERSEVPAWTDSHGAALLAPPERRELPPPCRGCIERPWCESVEIVAAPAYDWRRLGLIEANGTPTRRGIVFSFFQKGEGLAVAAALEDETYAIVELIFDLANLRAGPRFAGDESPFGGRLGAVCQRAYERADVPGYLEMGVPPEYGAGASEVVQAIVEHGIPRSKLLTESLRVGDIERGLIEWRSLLRHIVWAPAYDWPRWHDLKAAAARFIDATTSPALADLPPLTAAQQRK